MDVDEAMCIYSVIHILLLLVVQVLDVRSFGSMLRKDCFFFSFTVYRKNICALWCDLVCKNGVCVDGWTFLHLPNKRRDLVYNMICVCMDGRLLCLTDKRSKHAACFPLFFFENKFPLFCIF